MDEGKADRRVPAWKGGAENAVIVINTGAAHPLTDIPKTHGAPWVRSIAGLQVSVWWLVGVALVGFLVGRGQRRGPRAATSAATSAGAVPASAPAVEIPTDHEVYLYGLEQALEKAGDLAFEYA